MIVHWPTSAEATGELASHIAILHAGAIAQKVSAVPIPKKERGQLLERLINQDDAQKK